MQKASVLVKWECAIFRGGFIQALTAHSTQSLLGGLCQTFGICVYYGLSGIGIGWDKTVVALNLSRNNSSYSPPPPSQSKQPLAIAIFV